MANDFDCVYMDVSNMDFSDQDISQHVQKQEVKVAGQFCEQTESDVRMTADGMPRNTKITQGLHKDRTRDLLESQIAIPHELFQLLTTWPILSATAKKTIMELVSIGAQKCSSLRTL